MVSVFTNIKSVPIVLIIKTHVTFPLTGTGDPNDITRFTDEVLHDCHDSELVPDLL